jgi:hypothetical protein
VLGAHVDEVIVEPINVSDKVGQGVEPRLHPAPVVLCPPRDTFAKGLLALKCDCAESINVALVVVVVAEAVLGALDRSCMPGEAKGQRRSPP